MRVASRAVRNKYAIREICDGIEFYYGFFHCPGCPLCQGYVYDLWELDLYDE